MEPLIHPRDERTGLRYSILPMIHAIADDLLTPDEAAHHLQLISDHLLGPDGARLFDRPVGYAGGPMTLFQRAEASTFFGREIGIMYMHAHLRYAEALARVGDGPGLLAALALAQPVGMTDRVASARPRQSTCYYSSSDAAFADRYAARDGYRGIFDRTVPLEGRLAGLLVRPGSVPAVAGAASAGHPRRTAPRCTSTRCSIPDSTAWSSRSRCSGFAVRCATRSDRAVTAWCRCGPAAKSCRRPR